MTAWVSAHRVVLAHLVKVVTATATKESLPDATVTMLHNSIAPFFAEVANVDKALADRLTALAQQEVDRIFVASLMSSDV
jgi:hypothetical protein